MTPRLRSPERDATRLVGSPSLLLPSLRFQATTVAEWSLDLFYEPHRSPAGFVFAKAMNLGAGRYDLALRLTDPSVSVDALSLMVRHRPSGRTVRVPMHPGGEGLRGGFEVDQAGDYDLSLLGGKPASIGAVRLALRD